MNIPIPIEQFLDLAKEFPVIDVRSPAEFQQGHIQGAYNVPLFDNEERAKVGIAYKQKGRRVAILMGIELVAPKLSSLISQTEKIISEHLNSERMPTVLIHCWRGGMRSENFAFLLNLYGYKTHTLIKGYKAYRNFVLNAFNIIQPIDNILGTSKNFEFLRWSAHKPIPYMFLLCAELCADRWTKSSNPDCLRGNSAFSDLSASDFFVFRSPLFYIIGGETGSGKTSILRKLAGNGEKVIDLEYIAHHKGSTFGSLGEKPQPTQEQFENNLAYEWMKVAEGCVYMNKNRENVTETEKKSASSQFSSGQAQNHQPYPVIWLEDESRNIGKNQIPLPLWKIMKTAPLIKINVSSPLRIQRLVKEYGNFPKEELSGCILKIQERLGGQNVKQALEELAKGNIEKVTKILLAYYDKAYNYDLEKRNPENIFTVNCETADASINAEKIIRFIKTKFSGLTFTWSHGAM